MRSALACLFSLLWAAPAAADPLQALLDDFRASPGVQADFVEARHIAMLVKPLESSGRLHYAQGNLARVITAPAPSRLVVTAKQVRMFDGKAWKTIDLAAKPVVRTFAESFVTLLRGDRAALERLYAVTWTGDKKAWRLVLRPKVSPMDTVIDRLELSGRGLVVDTLAVHEKEGDWTQTTFSNVDPARRYSAAELAGIFEAP